jgi:hypothetical protein
LKTAFRLASVAASSPAALALEIPVETLDPGDGPLPWLDDAQFLGLRSAHVADRNDAPTGAADGSGLDNDPRQTAVDAEPSLCHGSVAR